MNNLVARSTPARALGVCVLIAAALLPDTAAALPGQTDPSGNVPDGSTSSAQVDLDIDVATADDADLLGAGEDITDNVDEQISGLSDAQDAVMLAEADVLEAQSAVDDTQDEIDALETLSDDVVMGTFMSPPADNAVDLVETETIGDLAVKRALLEMRTSDDADVLTALSDARGRLEDEQEDLEDALDDAEDARLLAQTELDDLAEAASQQALFALAVQQRIDRGLVEQHNMAELDPELAAQLEGEQQALSDLIDDMQVDVALEMAGVPPPEDGYTDGSSVITVVSGDLVEVSCPTTGGSITVHSQISRGLESLLNLAEQQGLGLCGTGFRDPQAQIQLRIQHCGSSEYAIYQAPSSACSPPTARPGSSNHEQGLAVDFTCSGRGVSSGDPCNVFLHNNANANGLYNLPSEPWHWSNDGT